MPEFLRLVSLSDALQRWLAAVQPLPTRAETVAVDHALGRVLAEDLLSTGDLPPFRRATVDGYAVRAADTYGATPSLPAYLHLAGEVPMGESADLPLQAGEAAVLHTGGMLPPDADAVVMLEDAQRLRGAEVEILRAVQSGANVLQPGEDLAEGDLALPAGTVLRPQEIGGLMALGILSVPCKARVRVGLLSSGDEVVPASATPGPGQVRDVNEGMLQALVSLAGGQTASFGIVPDDPPALEAALREAVDGNEFVIVSAGSSVSARDATAEVIARLGAPGILVHGLHVRPGKPTILAVAGHVPILGLPGNPVSALMIAHCLAVPMIRALLGTSQPVAIPYHVATLSENIASEAGREDLVPVALRADDRGRIAHPVYGRSNLIFTLVRAEGYLRIPAEVTGLTAGASVRVYPFAGGLAWPAPVENNG
jgi:molybdopterin molybdotransferase